MMHPHVATDDARARMPFLDPADISDPRFAAIVKRSEIVGAPKAEWWLATGHAPEVAVAYETFWDDVFRGGRVEHSTKELMRVAITSIIGCRYCSSQRSSIALDEGVTDDDMQACALPGFDAPTARMRAALRYARALASDLGGDDTDWDSVYDELHAHFDLAEVSELIYVAFICLGGGLVTRTIGILPDSAPRPAT